MHMEVQIIPAANALKFVALDISELLPRTAMGSKHVVIIADQLLKLTRTIPIALISSMQKTTTY